MKRILFLFLLWQFAPVYSFAQYSDQLVVFIQKGNLVSDDFMQNSFPELEVFAKKQNMQLDVIDIKEKGAPPEVSLTPMLVFQNENGRSFFKGRYLMLPKIKNFIRTVRRVPQEEISEKAGNNPVWVSGKSVTKAKLKLTELSGDVPDGFDQKAFIAEGKKWLKKGFTKFKSSPDQMLHRNNRAFYFDFYPHRSADGGFSVSMALYSMFNCIDPIYVQYDKPVTGAFKKRKAVFQKAAQQLEAAALQQLQNLKLGDAFEPVSNNINTKSWEALGLSLPPITEAHPELDPSLYTLGASWEMAGPVDAITPVIQFTFPSPVDHYSGEVREMTGSLQLDKDNSFKNANGKFSAQLSSFTMGDEQLDEHVLHDFNATEFPEAHFRFVAITEEDGSIAFGKTSKLSLIGELDFMGIKEQVNITAQVDPVIDENEQIFLQVYCAFQIRLKEKFGLDGPDGPFPENDTVVFNLNFLLKQVTDQ